MKKCAKKKGFAARKACQDEIIKGHTKNPFSLAQENKSESN